MSKSAELLEGTIEGPGGQPLTITMPRLHWQGLKWLVENEDSAGEITSLINKTLQDPERQDESDSQVVAWFVELYMENLFGGN